MEQISLQRCKYNRKLKTEIVKYDIEKILADVIIIDAQMCLK